MDQVRVWATRFLAPLVFIAATVVLVVVIERALDRGSSASTQVPTEPAVSVPVTTQPIDSGTIAVEKQYYRIKAGDTLEAIAVKFDTTVDALLQLNPGIDPLALEPGQRIRVA